MPPQKKQIKKYLIYNFLYIAILGMPRFESFTRAFYALFLSLSLSLTLSLSHSLTLSLSHSLTLSHVIPIQLRCCHFNILYLFSTFCAIGAPLLPVSALHFLLNFYCLLVKFTFVAIAQCMKKVPKSNQKTKPSNLLALF